MPDVTIIVDRDELKALLTFIPVEKLAYTPRGERAFGAFQTLERALEPGEPVVASR